MLKRKRAALLVAEGSPASISHRIISFFRPSTMTLRTPKILAKRLQKGDGIGFFSPSSPATVLAPKRFERAKGYLADKGYRLVPGNLTGKQDAYRSGTVKERAEELNTLIRNPEVRCIMSTMGGTNSNALLPYIDYYAFKLDPKILIGYSDVTALLLGIYTQTRVVTYYGPALVSSFGEFPPLVDQTFASFESLLCQDASAPYRYELPEEWTDERVEWEQQDRPKQTYPNTCSFEGSGVVQGRLIGGNLSTILGVWGSQYVPLVEDGDILLIEDNLKDISVVERAFAFLRLNGVFDKVSAVILGKHELFDDRGTGRAPYEVLQEVLDGQRARIVNGFDCCHTHPMLTLPIGVEVEVDFDARRVSLIEPWVANR